MKYFIRNIILMVTQVLLLSTCSYFSRDAARSVSVVEQRIGKKHTWSQRIVNSTFEIVNIEGDFNSDILLEKKNIIDLKYGSYPYNSKIIVTAKEGINGNYDKIIWSIDQYGDDAEQHYDFIRIIDKHFLGWDAYTEWDDVYYYYEIKTGRLLFASTSDLFPIAYRRKNLKRFICFYSGNTPFWKKRYKHYTNSLGIIRYLSLNGVKEEYMLTGDIEERPKTPKIKFYRNDLEGEYSKISFFSPRFNPDESIITDFFIMLRFNKKYEIKIPVVLDHLDIENAIVPKGAPFKIIPIGKSKSEYLMEERFQNIETASLDELISLKNEIRARNGYKFENDDLNSLFMKKMWYCEQEDEIEAEKLLTPKEKATLKKIEELQKLMSR